jgi:hypothetical protein
LASIARVAQLARTTGHGPSLLWIVDAIMPPLKNRAEPLFELVDRPQL